MNHPWKRGCCGAWVLAFFSTIPLWGQGVQFKRGDSTLDGAFDISDSVRILTVLFQDGVIPSCEDVMDVNDDGAVDVTDPVYQLGNLFLGGPDPRPPYPGCGVDGTGDGIGCEAYPHCIDCYDQADLDRAIAENVPPKVCLPEDLGQFTVGNFIISVCPSGSAPSCGPNGEPGCPIVVNTAAGTLDIPGRKVVIHIEGLVDDLPVEVKDSIFGNTVDCKADIDFKGDAVLPFQARPAGEGMLEITEVLALRLENPVVDLTATGGFLCSLLASQKDLVLPTLITQLEASAGELLAQVRDQLIGATICTPP